MFYKVVQYQYSWRFWEKNIVFHFIAMYVLFSICLVFTVLLFSVVHGSENLNPWQQLMPRHSCGPWSLSSPCQNLFMQSSTLGESSCFFNTGNCSMSNAIPIMVNTVGHTHFHTLRIRLWVHIMYQSTTFNIKGPCYWLRYFYWIETSVAL